MRTFQEFISEASKTYPSSVNQVAVRKKEKKDRKTAGDDMYSKPMPRAPGGPKPKRTPESTAAIKRRENLPPETKLRNIEKDIAHQKELEKQALHNITSGNTPPPTKGKSLEQMKAELAAQRERTFGSEHPLGPAPTPKPRPAPAAPIKRG